MPAINLGTPRVPEILAPRRRSRQIRVGKVLVGGDALDAGVVDEDVRVQAQIVEGCGVGEVDDPGLAAELGGERLGRGAVEVGDDDARAVRGERAGACGADAAGAARDERAPAVELAHA